MIALFNPNLLKMNLSLKQCLYHIFNLQLSVLYESALRLDVAFLNSSTPEPHCNVLRKKLRSSAINNTAIKKSYAWMPPSSLSVLFDLLKRSRSSGKGCYAENEVHSCSM